MWHNLCEEGHVFKVSIGQRLVIFSEAFSTSLKHVSERFRLFKRGELILILHFLRLYTD